MCLVITVHSQKNLLRQMSINPIFTHTSGLRLAVITGLFWAVTGCLFQQFAVGQILKRDTIRADLRHTEIFFTKDRYDFGNRQLPDTSLFEFPFYNPLQSANRMARQIGNVGQAFQSSEFEYDKKMGFHLGFRQFERYAYSRDSVRFYAGNYPYAQIKYTIGGLEEQSATITFAQALGSNLRYLVDYRMVSSPGAFKRQRANHQNLSSSIWFESPNKRYNAIGVFINNAATVQQNGGVLPEQLRLGDTVNVILDELLLPRTNVVNVRLANAENKQRSREMLLQQTYDLISRSGTIPQDSVQTDSAGGMNTSLKAGHAFSVSKFKNLYQDNSPPQQGFYPDFFISRTKTADSISSRTWKNELFVSWMAGKKRANTTEGDQSHTMRAGFTHEIIEINRFTGQDTLPIQQINIGPVSYTTQRDTIFTVTQDQPKLNSGTLNFVVHSSPKSNRFRYHVAAQYALFGFNAGDLYAEANLQLLWSEKVGGIRGKAITSRLTPDYIQDFYFSNHYRWNNDFNKINALQLEVAYFNPKLKLELSYVAHTFTGFIFWNEQATPQQLSEAINISRFSLQNQLRWRNFYLYNRMGLQLSSTDKVKLPLYWAQSLFYWQQPMFKNALLAQLGFLFNIQTDFFTNAYMPATGQFHLQTTDVVMAYPLLEVYGAFKIKRVRLYVKMEHLHQGLFKDKSYFTSPTYPGIDRVFRFGASWMFYD